MASCEANLSEEERSYLNGIRTYDDLKRTVQQFEPSVSQSTGPTLFQKLAPILNPLMGFVTLMAALLNGSAVETAIVWGLMSLLLRVKSPPAGLNPRSRRD